MLEPGHILNYRFWQKLHTSLIFRKKFSNSNLEYDEPKLKVYDYYQTLYTCSNYKITIHLRYFHVHLN